jgi:DNA-binding response OmpR family regulator
MVLGYFAFPPDLGDHHHAFAVTIDWPRVRWEMGIRGAFHLTSHEGRLLATLMEKNKPTRPEIMGQLYSHKLFPPETKVLDVMICHLRKKLAAHDIKIETYYGHGYWLTPETKARISAEMQAVRD